MDIIGITFTGAAMTMYQQDAFFLREAVESFVSVVPNAVKTTGYMDLDGFKIDILRSTELESTKILYNDPYGIYYPFPWYASFNYVTSKYETSTTYSKANMFLASTQIAWVVYENTNTQASFWITMYKDQYSTPVNEWQVELHYSNNSKWQITGTALGAYLISVYADSIPYGGTYDDDADDLIGAIPDGSIFNIPTTLTEPQVIPAASTGTLSQSIGAPTTADPPPTQSNYVPSQERVQSLGAIFITKFPFCIPWDFAKSIILLAAPAEAPNWSVDILSPIAHRVGGWQGSTTIEIDLAEYESLAALVRWFELLIFCSGLIVGTKRLIWTA